MRRINFPKQKVFLITPNTGLKFNTKKYYDLKFSPTRLKLSFFKKFPKGLLLFFFLFSVIKAISLKPDIFITRNLFTLFILIIFNKKVIIELHHDFSNEGRLVKFLYNNFNILNSNNIVKVVAITKAVKKFLVNELKVYQNKIQVISSASSLKIAFSKIRLKNKYNIGYFGSLEEAKVLNL